MRLPRTHTFCNMMLIGELFLVFGVRWREDRYSCHLCRSLIEHQTTTVMSWPLSVRQSLTRSRSTDLSHRHDWWRYSYAYADGLGGCLGSGVACHTDGRFKDEQRGIAVADDSPRRK